MNGFSRVCALLQYARPAKWLAILAGCTTAVLYTLLILLLALFADLLVGRGRIPNFAQLPVAEQQGFADRWNNIPEEARVAALEHVGRVVPPEADTTPEGRLNRALLAGEEKDSAPLPATATTETLRAWADHRQLSGDALSLASRENETRWKAYVWHYLKTHIDEEAANVYQPKVEAGQWPLLPSFGEDNRQPYGILGLAVRERSSFVGKLVTGFASAFEWSWNGVNDPNRKYLTGLLILGLLLVLLRTIAMIVMNESAARAALEVVTRLRRSIYHHTARQGAMTISLEAVDEAGGLFTKQVEEVHDALYWRLTYFYRFTLKVLLLMALALVTNPWLSLAFVVFAVLVWGLAGQMSASFRRQSKFASRIAANRLDLLLESLRLMRVVKLYLMELFNQSRVERQLSDYARAHLRQSSGDALARPLLIAFAAMAALILLYLSGRVVLNEGLSIPGLIILTASFLSIYYPLRMRLLGRRVMRHGRSSAANIFEFLDRRGDVATHPDAEFMPGLHKSLEFKDVSVREPGTGRQLLSHISFKVRAGQKVGVVSSNPEEQLALVSLIPRFLDPTSGEVKLDGRELKWITQDSLRSQIGLVLQNSLVFNDTVANNIGCGDPSYTLPQIIEAAKMAHAHQFIHRLPYGYETTIGDMGHSLTTGEQFRIALARAILREPSLYIIEEPADHLDEDTKDLVDDTLDRVLPGKTVIFLPHRMSTLRDCDKIYLLHNGEIVAEGQHRELISINELYRHLYYLEFNPFADQAVG